MKTMYSIIIKNPETTEKEDVENRKHKEMVQQICLFCYVEMKMKWYVCVKCCFGFLNSS